MATISELPIAIKCGDILLHIDNGRLRTSIKNIGSDNFLLLKNALGWTDAFCENYTDEDRYSNIVDNVRRIENECQSRCYWMYHLEEEGLAGIRTVTVHPEYSDVLVTGSLVFTKHRGNKFAAQTLIKVTDYALDKGIFHLVCAETEPDNGAAIRSLELAGFSCYGLGLCSLPAPDKYKNKLMMQHVKGRLTHTSVPIPTL